MKNRESKKRLMKIIWEKVRFCFIFIFENNSDHHYGNQHANDLCLAGGLYNL